MTSFYIMRVFWNTNSYRKPSGVAATKKTFPGKHGFASEEWNNSPNLLDKETNTRMFCLNRFEFPKKNNGNCFIFMYADHGKGAARRQDLVGIAGKAAHLSKKEQKEAMQRLDLSDFRDQAWAVDRVRNAPAYKGNRANFDRMWKFKPNWKCSANTFVWFDDPVRLNPSEITEKKYFSLHYKKAQRLSGTQAGSIMRSVPPYLHLSPAWKNLSDIVNIANPGIPKLPGSEFQIDLEAKGSEELYEDIAELLGRHDLAQTTRKALIEARVGQGQFRRDLETMWSAQCSVTGCNVKQMLRASHIKPWSKCTDAERLDPNNGLLLIANLDALFDKRLISFDQFGQLRTSTVIDGGTMKQFRISGRLRNELNQQQLSYLQWHFDACNPSQSNHEDEGISDNWCHDLIN
jgi:hypothetical protein